MAKKISFSYILNTRLKPRTTDGVKRYPVYAQVNYNRNNTHFPFPDKLYLSEKDFEQFPQNLIGANKENYKDIATQFEKELEAIIRFEISLAGESYTLRGLPKRIDFYEGSLYEALNEYILKEELLDALAHDLTLFDMREMERLGLNTYIQRVAYINQNISRLSPLEKQLSKGFVKKSSTLFFIGLCDDNFGRRAKFKDWILNDYHIKVHAHFNAMKIDRNAVLSDKNRPEYPFQAMDFKEFEQTLNQLFIRFSIK